MLNSKKAAWKPKYSYFTYDGGKTFTKVENAMEASVLVWMENVKEFGFKKSNGDEHSWYHSLWNNNKVSTDDLEPSYIYVWGEEIARHKQSGNIQHPNNFEIHKEFSQDFGDRHLEEIEYSICDEWQAKITF